MKIKKIKLDFDIIKRPLIFIVIIILTVFVAKLFSKIFDFFKKKDDKTQLKISKTLLFDFVKDMLYLFILLIGFSFALSKVGVQIKTILVILASLGFAIALSLKDFLTEIVSGIIIIFMDYFKVGDIIEVDGDWGIVSDFDLLNTTLKQISNVILTVPNTKIVNGAFTNYTKDEFIKIKAKICVSNTSKNINYKELLEGLKEDLKEIKYVVDGKTSAKIASFDEQGTIIQATITIKSSDYIPARSPLFLRVRDYFSRKNILLCDWNCIDFLE